MIISRRFGLQFARQIALISRYSTKKLREDKAHGDVPITTAFLARALGTHFKRSSEILEKHKELYSLKTNDVTNSVEMLKSLNYDLKEIQEKAMILYMNSLTIENRYEVFKECGLSTVPLSILLKYVTVMNKSVQFLKAHGVIPFDVNVIKRLQDCCADDVEVVIKESPGETVPLKNLRQLILNLYLKEKLEMSENDITKLWKIYSRVRHRSFKSVKAMIKILLEDLNFSKERIIKNGYLLYGDPANLQNMMREIKTIGNEDFREILYRRPKIAMSSTDALLKTIDNIKSFNIPETAITRCLEILTLGPDTVLERLKDLNEIEEFRVLVSNPRVLRLVHYQNKARLRLDYLNQLKVKCASLHILSCGSEAFAKFARDGSDRTKGRDVIVFLANILGIEEIVIRNSISRHPNWCHIPVVQIKQCYDFLINEKFNDDDIFHNMHVLLYPIKRIEEKLSHLKNMTVCQELCFGLSYPDIPRRCVLTLVLYFIESEFHFTGDGIWTDHHTQQVENFNNLLPDFPESFPKVYKYGMKPAGTRGENQTKAMNI